MSALVNSVTSCLVRGILLCRQNAAPLVRRRGLGSLKNVGQDCLPHHTVLIAPSLWLASPKNGNISNLGRRLSAISLPSCSNWEYRDGQPIHKKPQLAGTYRILAPSITTQCLRSPAGRIEGWRRAAGSRSPTIVRHALR